MKTFIGGRKKERKKEDRKKERGILADTEQGKDEEKKPRQKQDEYKNISTTSSLRQRKGNIFGGNYQILERLPIFPEMKLHPPNMRLNTAITMIINMYMSVHSNFMCTFMTIILLCLVHMRIQVHKNGEHHSFVMPIYRTIYVSAVCHATYRYLDTESSQSCLAVDNVTMILQY